MITCRLKAICGIEYWESPCICISRLSGTANDGRYYWVMGSNHSLYVFNNSDGVGYFKWWVNGKDLSSFRYI